MSNKENILGFEQKDLDKAIEQATKLGIGFAIVSKDALEIAIKRVSKENSVSEKEARKAINNLVIESKLREKQLQHKVANAIKVVKTKSPVVPREEADKLKAEIKRLKEQLKAKKKK